MIRILQFIAIALTALYLVPGGAHLLEMTSKIALDQEQYRLVQQIYRGWALLGVILIAAILANAFLCLMVRSQPVPMACAAAAVILLCLGLAIFFGWTYPVNQTTRNWTLMPDNWQALRWQWELSHAANACVTFLTLSATIASGLAWSLRRRH